MSLQDDIKKLQRKELRREVIRLEVVAYDDGSQEVNIHAPENFGMFTVFGVLEHAARKVNMGLLTGKVRMEEEK